MNIRLFVSYLGTRYCGWQVQKNGISIQEKIQDAVQSLFGVRFSVTGCSRTDSGVHARMYCCTVLTDGHQITVPPEKIPIALNHYLPDDISVINADFCEDSFHPRYNIKYKEYEYLVLNSQIRDPYFVNRAFLFPHKLNVELMDGAAKMFVGKKDFSAFMSKGTDIADTVRNIMYFNVSSDGDLIKFNVAADGFLYNMVRILVGTLIEVSQGKINIEDINNIITSKNRSLAGFTAPPEGLYLNKLFY